MKKIILRKKLTFFKNSNLFSRMKWTVCFAVLAVCQLSAAGSYAQETEITLKLRNVTLGEALNAIEAQTDFVFFFRHEEIDLKKKVGFEIEKGKITDILDKIVPAYTYLIENKQILLRVRNTADTQRITGRITDAKGEAVIGANVAVEGSSTGTISDIDGRFDLAAPAGSTLKISFIGYLTYTEKIVSGKTHYAVVLREDSQSLDEVVVVGYGTQKRSELTGSISSVKSDDIKDASAKSLSEALGGRVAGVMVTKGEGSPGSSADIIIRGAGSINGLGPLYIVDGVRMGTDFDFNMRDVESVEILKDAGSSAIYGAQAAGGVILITTKRGASEKMKIDVNARFGLRRITPTIELLGRDDYIRARQQIGMDILSLHGVSSAAELPDVDWMDEMYSTGKEQEYNVALSGSSEKYNYYLSGGYYRDDGVYLDTWSQRFSFRANADYKINKRITVGESFYGNTRKSNPWRSFVGSRGIPFRTTPAMEVHDPDNLGGWAKTPSYLGGPNLVGNEYIYHYTDNNYHLDGVVYGNWLITDGLNFRVTLGGTFRGWSNNAFTEAYDFGTLKQTQASMTAKSGTSQDLTFHATLTYEKKFGNHSFKWMAGTEALKNDAYDIQLDATNFTVPVAESIQLSSNANKTGTDHIYTSRTLSYFGRLNYSYLGKYLLTANVRRDGSDKFGVNNRWGTFPSMNGAWRISEESFVKDRFDWLTNAKLRVSWGILGNDGIGQYLYQEAYQAVNLHNYGGGEKVQGWANVKFPNRDIKWEEIHQTDIGLDFGFFNNRLTFTYDWYNRQTRDMLYQLSIPLTSGIGTYGNNNTRMPINIGKVENIGSEIAVDWQDRRGGWEYGIGFNASFNRNKVIKIGEDGVVLNDGSAGEAWRGTVSRTEDGQPMGQFYGYRAVGIFQTQEQVEAYNAKAQAAGAAYYQSAETGPGDLIYDDLGAGYVSSASQTYIGNPWPKMVYGLRLDAAYKGFDLSLLFQGAAGFQIYNAVKAYTQNFYGDANTTADIFDNSFFGDNGLTDMPRSGYFEDGIFKMDPNSNYSRISSFWVENGNYLKLKNLVFGYTLPEKVSRKFSLPHLRFYISAQNLFTLTKYSGIDPEIGGSVRQRGIDTYTRYLPSRLVSFGLDLTF